MAPTFDAGDAIAVAPADPAELRPGMVVTFHAPGEPEHLTTHRIASLRPKPEGLFIQTQGDANATADPNSTPASSVVGIMGRRLPIVGHWLVFFQSRVGRIVVLGAPLVALVVSEAAGLIRLRRKRVRRGADERGRGTRTPAGMAVATAITLVISIVMGVTLQSVTGAAYTASAAVAANSFSTRSSFCATTADRSAVTADSPGRWYRLGEVSGSVADDATATATTRNGTYRNAPTLGVAGALRCDTDTAASFNGCTHHVTTGDLQASPTTFSIEAWFKTTTGGGRLVGFGNASTGTSTRYDRHVYLTPGPRRPHGGHGFLAVARSRPRPRDRRDGGPDHGSPGPVPRRRTGSRPLSLTCAATGRSATPAGPGVHGPAGCARCTPRSGCRQTGTSARRCLIGRASTVVPDDAEGDHRRGPP